MPVYCPLTCTILYSLSKSPLNNFVYNLSLSSTVSEFVFLHQFFVHAIEHTLPLCLWRRATKDPHPVSVCVYTHAWHAYTNNITSCAKSYSSRSELGLEFVNMQVHNMTVLTFTDVIILLFYIQRFMNSLPYNFPFKNSS